jgi:GAF domain-containing protein
LGEADKPTQPPAEELHILHQQLARLQAEKELALQTVEKRLAELHILNKISQAAAAETDLNDLYQVIHLEVKQILGEVNFLIATYDPFRDQIEIPYVYEDGEILHIDPFPLGEGLTSILIHTRQSLLLVEDTENKAKALGAKMVGAPAKSWLGVPLIFSGEATGAIIVQDTEREGRFSEDDQRLLTTLAGQIAIAIRNVELLDATRRLAERERLLAGIFGKIWASTDIETILRTALGELGQVMNASTGRIELQTPPISD